MGNDPKTIGPYEIQGVIGSGGMGVVYRAVQPSLKRFVAIKVLPAHLAENREFVERFMREARSVAALDHPSIVSIYDIGESDGAYYFVMKFLVGDTLHEYIEEEGRLPLDRALLFAEQLADALGTAHESGVIHRDVKPANIIVDPRETRVALTDFGIALTLEETRLTQPGTMFGSPIYIAPEQLEGGDVDHRADFYSLGSVLYQMLAGVPPYQAEMPVAILHQRISDPERSVREINPEVPVAVDSLVRRMMARDPDERPGSAAELLEEIRRLRAAPDEPLDEPAPATADDDEAMPTVALGAIDLPADEGPAGDTGGFTVAAGGGHGPQAPQPPPTAPPVPPEVDAAALSTGAEAATTAPPAGLKMFFGSRRVILGWIGAMAVLLVGLMLIIWWSGRSDVPPERRADLSGAEQAGVDTAAEGESLVDVDSEDGQAEPGETESGEGAAADDEETPTTKPPAASTAAIQEKDDDADASATGEEPTAEKPARPTEVGPSGSVETETPPPVKRTPPRRPAPPAVSEAEMAEALTGARQARRTAEEAGAAQHAPGLWASAVAKLEEGTAHGSKKELVLEKRSYEEARQLFVQAAETAGEETARQAEAALADQQELGGLKTSVEQGIAAGTMAGLEDAGQALARYREIAPEDEGLERLALRHEEAEKRFWQSHGITRSFTVASGVEMEFIWVPPGTFRMGTVEKKRMDRTDESPKHTVVISRGFWLGKYEVTQSQWQAVMGGNPSSFKSPDRPVDSVSWNDAQAFLGKLNAGAGGVTYRLPTEAEWEFTCRAGTSRSFYAGEINVVGCENEDNLSPYGWYCYNSSNETHPVGRKKPNGWGFHDMHGNVGEWCADRYDKNYYEYSPTRDPKGPDSGKTRVLRGGGWDFRAWDCRSAYRGNYRPGANNNSFGLRIVREATP